MNLESFTPEQRRALLDLTLLAQYADGHLAMSEDARIQAMLGKLGFAGESAVREYDGAAGRVRRFAGNAGLVADEADRLAAAFPDHASRAEVLGWLASVVESDRHVTAAEADLLAIVREALQR